jgi:hypothetical protein
MERIERLKTWLHELEESYDSKLMNYRLFMLGYYFALQKQDIFWQIALLRGNTYADTVKELKQLISNLEDGRE